MDAISPLSDAFVKDSTRVDDEPNNTVKKIKTLLKFTKTKISKDVNNVCKNFDRMNTFEKKKMLKNLTELKCKLSTDGENLFNAMWDSAGVSDDEFDKQRLAIETYDEKLNDIIFYMEENLKPPVTLPKFASDASAESGPNFSVPQAHLPNLELPKWDGNILGYSEFMISFQNALKTRNLDSQDKFLFLKKSLQGPPKSMLERLPCSKQNFKDAKDVLDKAYCDVHEQKSAFMESLTNLKFNPKEDHTTWYSTVISLDSLYDDLMIDKEAILRYFFWRSLPRKFKDTFTNVLGKFNPTKNEIIDNYLSIARLNSTKDSIKDDIYVKNNNFNQFKSYSHQYPSQKNQNQTQNVNAVKINQNFSMCRLCKPHLDEGQNIEMHSITNCTRYSSSQSRVNRLKALNYCPRCTTKECNSGGIFQKCNYELKNRCACGNHVKFLCPKVYKNDNDGKNSSNFKKSDKVLNKESKNKMSKIFCSPVNLGNKMAPPIINLPCVKNNKITKLLTIIDTGAQFSFISERALKFISYTFVNNTRLTVCGINSTKKYYVKEIMMKIVVGGQVKPLYAAVLPDLDSSYYLPGLSCIYKMFSEKGYYLSNYRTKNDYYDMEIILGTNAIDNFNLNFKQFGVNKTFQSTYIDSSLGIIPVGNLIKLKNNMQYLPKNEAEKTLYNISLSNCEDLTYSDPNTEILLDENDYYLNFPEFVSARLASVLDDFGRVDEEKLDLIVKSHIDDVKIKFNENDNNYMCENDENNSCLLSNKQKEILEKTMGNIYKEEGRLVAPIVWKEETKHNLANNFYLSKKVLDSNIKKLKSDTSKLQIYDKNLKDQEELGILERIPNTGEFLSSYSEDQISFLAHMGVWKDKPSSPLRIVLLSNLAQKGESHNHCIESGINLCDNILKNIIFTRFGKYLVITDMKKSFLQIRIPLEDQLRFLILWYEDALSDCKNLIIYKHTRVPFGTPCSTMLLMCCLLYELVCNIAGDDEEVIKLKKLLYNSAYVDNIYFPADTDEQCRTRFRKTIEIFKNIGFKLHQFTTNNKMLLSELIEENLIETEVSSSGQAPLLGLLWNYNSDYIELKKINLDVNAKSKRSVWSSVNSVWDVLGLSLPYMCCIKILRKKIDKLKLQWDDILPDNILNEWIKITKKLNSINPIKVTRYLGNYEDSYDIVAYCDASRELIATVLYLKNNRSGKVEFLCAKNKIVSGQMEKKSTPVLEALSLEISVELCITMYRYFTDAQCSINIENIYIFSDSQITLNWLQMVAYKYDDLRKRGPLLKNRINNIIELSKIKSIKVSHIRSENNLSDLITRAYSHKIIQNSRYYHGPENVVKLIEDNVFLSLPNPETINERIQRSLSARVFSEGCIINVKNYSSFIKIVRIIKNVFIVVHNLKVKIKKVNNSNENFFVKATNYLIKYAQSLHFQDIIDYLNNGPTSKKLCPLLHSKLNLFMDKDNIIRVRSKLKNSTCSFDKKFPILLFNKCHLTNIIISDYHIRCNHLGQNSLINKLRNKFWILKYVSTIKRNIIDCAICAHVNRKPLVVNQNDYRDFRVNPETSRPYAFLSVDMAGPYVVKMENNQKKVWLCLFTCFYSRHVNIIISYDITALSFLRCLQMHCFRFGTPSYILADRGSNFTGAKSLLMNEIFNDADAKNFLYENDIRNFSFDFVPTRAPRLNSLVEVLVKQVKNLIFKSIGNKIIDICDFNLMIERISFLINSRPISFKQESLGEDPDLEVITSNHLVYGYEPQALEILPSMLESNDPEDSFDPEWKPEKSYDKYMIKLKKIKHSINKIYYNDFITTLIKQSTDKNNRYIHKNITKIEEGDLVAILTPSTKRLKYPKAVVIETISNDIGEITTVKCRKSNGEITELHVSQIILLLKGEMASQ